MKEISSSLLLSSPGSFDNHSISHRIVARRAKPADQRKKHSLPATKDGLPGLEGPFRDIGNMLVHLTDAKVEVFDSFVGRRNNKSLEEVCLLIQEFFAQPDRHLFLIYYTGHGINLTGDWVFKDGELTFEMLLALWQARPQKYDHLLLKEGRQELAKEHLVVVSDSCFSGVWVNKAKKYFGSFSPDISIQGACQAEELAWDLGPGEGGCFTSLWLDKKLRKKTLKHRKKLEKIKNKTLFKMDKYIAKIRKKVLVGAKHHLNSVSLFFLVAFDLHRDSELASLETLNQLLKDTSVTDDLEDLEVDLSEDDFSDSSDDDDDDDEDEDEDEDEESGKARAPKLAIKPKLSGGQKDSPPASPNTDEAEKASKKIKDTIKSEYKIVKFLAELFSLMGQDSMSSVSPLCQFFYDLDMRRAYAENEKCPPPLELITNLEPRIFVLARTIMYFFIMHQTIFKLKHYEKARLLRHYYNCRSAMPPTKRQHLPAGGKGFRNIFNRLSGRRSVESAQPQTQPQPQARAEVPNQRDDTVSLSSMEAESQLISSAPPIPCSFLGDGVARAEAAFNIALSMDELDVFRSLVENVYDREEKFSCRYWSREDFAATFCREFSGLCVGKAFFDDLMTELSKAVKVAFSNPPSDSSSF